MKYKFKMSIGDWSNDGHGMHEDYLVSSNAPVEKVREAHFAMRDILGFSVEDICSGYEESEVETDVAEKLRTMGFEFDEMDPETMARLWVFLLGKTDPTLELKIMYDEVPTLHFYGFDNQKRHISFVGYGLFD